MVSDTLKFIFRTCLQKYRGCFLNNLHKSWESLVTLQLPSDCYVIFGTNESEKQVTITFCTNLPKRKDAPIMEMSRDKYRKREESTYMEMSRDND